MIFETDRDFGDENDYEDFFLEDGEEDFTIDPEFWGDGITLDDDEEDYLDELDEELDD